MTLIKAEPDSHVSSDFLINAPDLIVIGHGCFSAGLTNAASIPEWRLSIAGHGAEITFRAIAALRTDQNLSAAGGIHADHVVCTLTAGVTPESLVHTFATAEFFRHHGDDLPFAFSAASGAIWHSGEQASFCTICSIS